jgi:predicted dehydrogenase
MPVRIAAIEVSHWHSVYDPAYLRQLVRMPDVEIVALHDPDPGVAARRAEIVGNPPVFIDYKDMLRDVRPDFVLALGRHSVMAEIAHHLLDHGFPFLMEKPMGFDAEEVRTIAKKATAKKGYAAVPMPQRYTPFFAQAQSMLTSGSFGPLSHVYVRTNGFSSARYPLWDSPWMLDPAISNGGCLRNLGVHGFDMFLQLTGEEAAITGAQLSRRARGQQVEDYASVLLRSASGVLGTLEVGNAYPRQSRESQQAGQSPDRLLDGADAEWKILGRDAMLMSKDGMLRTVTATAEETRPNTPSEAPSYRVLADAIEHWRRGDPPPVSVHDCHRAVRLVDEAYQMAGVPVPPP